MVLAYSPQQYPQGSNQPLALYIQPHQPITRAGAHTWAIGQAQNRASKHLNNHSRPIVLRSLDMSLVSALQIPYREARDGFWGEQTSTLNWCEEVRETNQPFNYPLPLLISSHSGLQHHVLLCRGRQHRYKLGLHLPGHQGITRCHQVSTFVHLHACMARLSHHRSRLDGVPRNPQMQALPLGH